MTPILSPYDLRKKIEFYGITLLVLVAIFFGAWKAYPLILGPTITIYNPHEGDIVRKTTFELSGQVSRVKEITIQGRPVPIGTDGHFTEIVLAQAPYTVIIISATDFYGKSITKTLRVSPEK